MALAVCLSCTPPMQAPCAVGVREGRALRGLGGWQRGGGGGSWPGRGSGRRWCRGDEVIDFSAAVWQGSSS
jgi:hypothetical protein